MSRRLSLTIFFLDIAVMLTFILSRWHMTITLDSEPAPAVAYGQTYTAPSATAHFLGKDIELFDRDFPITAENAVDTSVIGEQTVRYHASRLFYHADVEVKVNVVDDSPPVLQLGDVPLSIDAGQNILALHEDGNPVIRFANAPEVWEEPIDNASNASLNLTAGEDIGAANHDLIVDLPEEISVKIAHVKNLFIIGAKTDPIR